MKLHPLIILFLIVIIAFCFRFYSINWDQGFHLHPDERAILLFTLPLQFPTTLADFFSQASTWNPHFFAYGSFPLYLLKISGTIGAFFDIKLASYDGVYLIGRAISAFFDIGTCILLYFLIKKLFFQKLALLVSFFYAVSVLPIQLSHFYAVDTILTFFTIFLLYQLLRFYDYPTKRKAISIGIILGFAFATKTSAFVLFVPIVITITIDFILIVLKQPHRVHLWIPHVPRYIRRLCLDGSLICCAAVTTFFFLEPYAFIDSSEFLKQTVQQSEMTKNAFIFPYTLQYVGKIPYFYELKNILLWGLGPILGISSLIGLVWYHSRFFQKKIQHFQQEIILLSFFWMYFLIVGSFSVGFMRYMLPLYPFFCLFAGFFIYYALGFLNRIFPLFAKIAMLLFLLLTLIWPLSFMHIYTTSNTRVLASNWMYQNIPITKTLAVEHWDDQLPIGISTSYTTMTLPLYEPDTEEKWDSINAQLEKTDYIVLASNRLYVPLQRLTDCEKLFPHPCYKETATYYKQLFSNQRGFTKIKEFTVYPKIPFTNISIIDDAADESFTVYDHPKIVIFKKK